MVKALVFNKKNDCMRMQESFEGDTESPNKRLMKKLGFFHRPSASLFNFLQVLLAFPCS